MTTEARAAMFDPDGFTQGGGLLDDADVLIKAAQFAFFSYPGSNQQTTALMVTLEDENGKEHEQPYSVGAPEKFVPSEDGRKVLLTGTATAINVSSNFGKFAKSLIDAGVPKTLLQTDDISVIVGMRLHVQAVAQKDRDGKTIKNDKGYDRTVLLATKLIALPGEKPKGATSAKGSSKTATGSANTGGASGASSASTVDNDLADRAVGYLIEIIANNNGEVPRAKVSAAAFQLANKAKDPNKSDITKLVFDENFLRSRAELAYENGVIKLAA